MKSELDIVSEFSAKLGLKNQTDGTLFIYKKDKDLKQSIKPDGYYYYEGITFILDAKAWGKKFNGQLEHYMRLESNANFVGFAYNGKIFKCYVNGKLKPDEKELQNKDYYKRVYFPTKINNEIIVNNSAKKLANLFRNSGIDKQMNVPFIGAVILCMKYGKEIDLSGDTTSILRSIALGIKDLINDNPINRRAKREFIVNRILNDGTLKKANFDELYTIIAEISTIYNFINISAADYKGHDIMNNFLRVFRRWNSANSNEKGEVFTPEHIAQLMYKLGSCTKDDFILDPSCGSGTFLIVSMANMFNEALKMSLSDEEFEKMQVDIKSNRLFGIEINEFNATLAGMNMLLHGDGASNIYNENCFSKLKSLEGLYTKVLMNPPFSQKDIELSFVYETLYYMAEGGILVSILPKSSVKGSIEANIHMLRKIFALARLKAVISLPRGLFYPVGADTCIIVLHKQGSNEKHQTLLINCLDDGFKISNETRVADGDKWMPIEKQILKAFFDNEYDEFRAISKELSPEDELLFEAYSSHRAVDIDKSVFEKYLREYISAKVLCGKELKPLVFEKKELKQPFAFERFDISELIIKLEKGKDKSLDRKVENKYEGVGTPIVIAKKDNNGIGGLKSQPHQSYEDKLCLICGGDGGGGKCYYIEYEFCATGFVMVCEFRDDLKNISKYAKFYISIVISERLFKTIGHGRTISKVPQTSIKLPVKNAKKELDIAYMENFIKNFKEACYM